TSLRQVLPDAVFSSGDVDVRRCCAKLKLIGITGSHGKTTTSYLTAAVLAAGGTRSGVLGALGYFDGEDWQNARWTTPPPSVLAHWLDRIAAGGCTHAVMEVSNHALNEQRVAGLDFDVVCVTNVRRDHVDRQRALHGHRMAKARLFDQLLPEGFAVINVDDPMAESFLARLDGPVLTVGMHGAAEVTGLPLEQLATEQTFLLSVGDESIPVRTPLIGNQNIYNCLVAAAVGLAYSIDLPTIVQGLEVVQRVPGRLERLECGQPFGVFVDSAHTAGALSRCLETLRAVTSGRLICVFGAGRGRDKSMPGPMGRAVEVAADLVVVTNDSPGSEPPEDIAAQIVGGFRDRSAARVIFDRREAIAWALAQAQLGDCVLIAGRGNRTTHVIGGEQYEFDDRQAARQWLYESLAPERLYRASA
ncbi:MAG: Mur ligase family protein, partial [Candidatus Saccharimonadales bacterium]